jgi:heptosyltransferase-2
MKPPSDLAHGRILVRGVNWLGDAVMTTPALLRLREAFPEAHISLLVPEKLKDLWQQHPAVNEVLTFAAGESVFSVSRRLRRGKFTHALVLPNSPRSALEVFAARIPRRIGYARSGRAWLLTQPVAPRADSVKMHKRTEPEIRQLIADSTPATARTKPVTKIPAAAHQIHEYLHLVASLGADARPLAPVLQAAPFADTGLARFFAAGSQRTGCLIGLNPGAEYGPAKRWPVEYFAAAANELYRRLDCEFLIFGGPADVALAEQLRARLPVPLAHGHVTSLAGKTKLGELMSVLKICRVLITNDTGPMHVAAALGTPVVVPFGSTSPELTGPGLPGDPRHRLLKSTAPCAPCFRRECPIDLRCLHGITVDRVVSAATQIVGT